MYDHFFRRRGEILSEDSGFESYDVIYSFESKSFKSSHEKKVDCSRFHSHPLTLTPHSLHIFSKMEKTYCKTGFSEEYYNHNNTTKTFSKNDSLSYDRYLKSLTLVISTSQDTFSLPVLIPDLLFLNSNLEREINKSVHHIEVLLEKIKMLQFKCNDGVEVLPKSNSRGFAVNGNVFCSFLPYNYFLSKDRYLKYRHSTFSSVFEEEINPIFFLTHKIAMVHGMNKFFGWFFPLTSKIKRIISNPDSLDDNRLDTNLEDLKKEFTIEAEVFPIIKILRFLVDKNPFIIYLKEEFNKNKISLLNVAFFFLLEHFKIRYLNISESKTRSSYLSSYIDSASEVDVQQFFEGYGPKDSNTDAKFYSECTDANYTVLNNVFRNIDSCEYYDWIKSINRIVFSPSKPLYCNENSTTCISFCNKNYIQLPFSKITSCYCIDPSNEKYISKTCFYDQPQGRNECKFASEEEIYTNSLTIPDSTFYRLYVKTRQIPIKHNKEKGRETLNRASTNIYGVQQFNRTSPYYVIIRSVLNNFLRLNKNPKKVKSKNSFVWENTNRFSLDKSSSKEKKNYERLIYPNNNNNNTYLDADLIVNNELHDIHKSPRNTSLNSLKSLEEHDSELETSVKITKACISAQVSNFKSNNSTEITDTKVFYPFFHNSGDHADTTLYSKMPFQEALCKREQLFVGYTLPKLEMPKFEISSPCLEHYTTPFITVSDKSTIYMQISDFYLDGLKIADFSVQSMLTPFLLKICRLTSTNPFSLLVLNLNEDLPFIDSSVLSYFFLTVPNSFSEANDEDILNVNRLFNARFHNKEYFKNKINSLGCVQYLFENNFDEYPFLQSINNSDEKGGNLLLSNIKKNYKSHKEIHKELNHSYLISHCAKEILLYSDILKPSRYNNLICYIEPKLNSPNNPCRINAFCAWYYSDSVSPEDLDFKLFKNYRFIDISDLDSNKYKDVEISVDIHDSHNFNDGNACMLYDVPLLSTSLIEKELSTWEKLYHKTDGINAIEDTAYLSSESEDFQSSCDFLEVYTSNNGDVSETSSQSSGSEEYCSLLSDECFCSFEQFSVPVIFGIPKIEPSAILPVSQKELSNMNTMAPFAPTSFTSDNNNAFQCKNRFENNVGYDIDFESDRDFEYICTNIKKKIEGSHPLNQTIFQLSLQEYEECDDCIDNHSLFPCLIFNNPRDFYAFKKYTENPLTGPLSTPFKHVFEMETPFTQVLAGKKSIRGIDKISCLKQYYISIKDVKLISGPLCEHILNHYYVSFIKSRKLKAKEMENMIALSRKKDHGRLQKDFKGSFQSSSDILHIMPNSTAESTPREPNPVKQAQFNVTVQESNSNLKESSEQSMLVMAPDILSESSILTFELSGASYTSLHSHGCCTEATPLYEINKNSDHTSHDSCQERRYNATMIDNLNINKTAEENMFCADILKKQSLLSHVGKKETCNSTYFTFRFCTFPIATAFKKYFDVYALWLALHQADNVSLINNEMQQTAMAIKNGLHNTYDTFIQKLYNYYHITEQDLLSPEYDLRCLNRISGHEYNHWLSLTSFFDPYSSDSRADTRTGKELLRHYTDNEGLEFFPSAIAWLPNHPHANSNLYREENIKMVACSWQRVVVYDYICEDDAYLVIPVSLEYSPRIINRTYIVFLFENTDFAAERIYKAVLERNIAEEQLRSYLFYNFAEPFLVHYQPLFREAIPTGCEIEFNEPQKMINQLLLYPDFNQPSSEFKSIRKINNYNDLLIQRPCRNLRKTNKQLVANYETISCKNKNANRRVEIAHQNLLNNDLFRRRNLLKAGLFVEKTKGQRLVWKIKRAPKVKKLSLIPKRHYSLRKVKARKRTWNFETFSEILSHPVTKIVSIDQPLIVYKPICNAINKHRILNANNRYKYSRFEVQDTQQSKRRQCQIKPINVFDSTKPLNLSKMKSTSPPYSQCHDFKRTNLPIGTVHEKDGQKSTTLPSKTYKCENEIFNSFNEAGGRLQRAYIAENIVKLIFDRTYDTSVILKLKGDFKKCAYSSQSALFYSLYQVDREAAYVKGLALIRLLTIKTETRRPRFNNSCFWDLEIMPLKRPSIKLSYTTKPGMQSKHLSLGDYCSYELLGTPQKLSCLVQDPSISEKEIGNDEISLLVQESKVHLDSVIDYQNAGNQESLSDILTKKSTLYEWLPFKFQDLTIKMDELLPTNITMHRQSKFVISRLKYDLMKCAFRENYLFSRPQMYSLLEKHYSACYHLKNIKVIYTPKMKKCRDLSTFIEISTQHTENVIKELLSLRNVMLRNMKTFLDKHDISTFMMSFKKNEFSLNLKSVRLVKFFTFLLSEAMRTCLQESVIQFEHLIEGMMGKLNEVNEDYVWGLNLHSNRFEGSIYHPFFKMKLLIKNKPHFSENIDLFEEQIMDAIWVPIELMVQMGPLNPFAPSLDLWPENYNIKSYGIKEMVIVKAIKTIKTLIHKNVVALKSYLKEYEPESEILNLEPEEYALNFISNNSVIETVIEEVRLHQREGKKALRKFPRRIVIGMFEISTRWMGIKLMHHHNSISKFLTMYYGVSYSQKTTLFTKTFSDIYTDFLPKKAMDFEQLFESERIVNEAYRHFQKIVPEILQHFAKFEKLAELRLNLSESEVIELGELIYRISVINQKYVETGCFELPKMKHVLIECLKYYEEQFLLEIEEVAQKVLPIKKQNDIKEYQEICASLKTLQESIDKLMEKAEIFKYRREMLGIRPRDFIEISQITKDIEPYKVLWYNVLDWRTCKKAWFENEIGKTDINLQEAKFNDCYRLISRSIRDFRSNPDLQALSNNIRDEMDQFRFFMEVFHFLHAPFFSWHFEIIKSKTGIDLNDLEHKSFSDLLDLGVLRIVDVLKEWSENATREYAIYCGLQKISNEWKDAELVLIPHRKLKYYSMKITDEHLQMLEDHKSQLLQLLYSPFRGNFEEELLKWEKNLRICNEAVTCLLECQKLWLYLEPIFSSPDIAEQLPKESSLFMCGDSFWKYFMKLAKRKGNIMLFAGDKKLLRQANSCFGLFRDAMLGLNKYMEGKRQAFPRFYFLSDEELIDMLSQGKNPLAVQPHLRKCFENIYKLTFKKDLCIVAMSSLEGELVKMSPSMYPEGILEEWLNKLESIMKRTVRVNAYHALIALAHTERAKWILQWPGQIVIAGSQTIWTARIERGIERNKMTQYFQRYLDMLDELRSVIRGELTKVQRQVVSSLIVIEVHARDVFETLVHLNITSVKDFNWISQLRYYWIKHNLKVKAMNAVFKYGYEYLGNSGRLVITPLTDRCYLTLTGALHLKFGGAPAGPAGTGKTESTKDLAKAFAIQCVVFNCSDQLDYKAMGKFFKGLAGSGAWACFDEFNRIDIEVLSVVAQQITTIQQAQFARATSCLFEGAWIKLKSSCAVFITMNPGYAGRTELPDNLKALFRPVAMMVPDYTLIAEISLFSFGFSDSKLLAGKITTTFKLSSEQLSTQDHYDFGMRAVKTVIAVAGNLKREHPKMDERQIILRALNDVNVPKFLTDDLKLFRGIVSDLFPLMEAQAIDYGSFKRNIKWIIFKEFKLQPVDNYVTKVIQLYETTVVRHGLMLVGPAGSGKTKCYEILQRTMTFCKGQTNPNGGKFSRVNTYVLNPKAITMGQLYGEVDINTLEWTDGILPFYARKGAISNNDHKRWYVFDGPVDAVWIENMNTVLDDNKKLCLTSGEVIKMSDHMTMVFEVADLAVASPATVSRCGMVYLEPGVLGLEPYIEAWIRRLPRMVKPFADRFRVLLKRYTLNCLKFLRKYCNEFVPSMDTNILQSCFRLLNAFLKPVKLRDTGRKPTNEVLFQIRVCMTGWVVFSTLWSAGATCDDSSREKFSEYLKYKINKHNAFPRSPKRSLYDYNFSDGGFSDIQNRTFNLPRWVSWTSKVTEYVVKSDVSYSDIEVPTIDNIRSANLVGRLLEAYHDVLCVGPTGTGKSITIMSKLTRSMPNDFVVDFMTFSARTTSRQTQEVIEAKLEKIKKFVRGAPNGKVQILFIDDFNMPAPETYGAQPPLELIRQFMDFGGWYLLLEVGQFLKIVDVTIVAAMGPPGGGRNSVSARLLRHFHYISFPELSYISKKMIFGTILLSWIERMQVRDRYAFGLKVLELTLDTYSTIERELLPTPAKMHYTFNLRDLSKVFQGILMAKAEKYSKAEFLILWYHEHCRVYGDRLVNDEDNKWFDDVLANKVIEHLDIEPNWPKGVLKKGSTSLEFTYHKEHLVFADLLTAFDDKIYERVPNIILLSKVLELYLYAYNISAKIQMDLVLFEEAVSHVCRISRIIRQPLGNALLLGLAGSGRQSVTRLAATTMEYTCFQVELTKAYSMSDWRDDLKKMMMGAGLYKKDTVFLFSDTQVKFEGFLEDINNILNSGDVPNMYQIEDKDLIMGAVRNEAIDQGIAPTYPNLFTFYLKQIKSRLHTVVTMSPIGEVFRARLRQFPALVNCCTIDWFSEWPELALRRVGNHYISRAARSLKMPMYLTAPVVQSCLFIHTTVLRNRDLYLKECARQVYITPSHFLEFLRTFIILCEDKVGKNYAEIIRLTEGIQKLTNTEDEIADMQDTILRAEPELIRQGKTAENMLQYIEKSKAAAQIKSKKILKSTLEIAKIRRNVADITYEARIKLAKAMPELLAAKEELQTLNKNDLSEIKALAKPPPGVRLTMEAVCVLLNVAPALVASEIGFGKKVMDYWIPATKLLADPGKFLQILFGFKIENVEYSTILKLKKYIEDPEFEPQKIKKASKACMSLCKWVFAMVKYYYVNKDIEPKIKALKEARQLMRKMNAQLRHSNKLLTKTKNRIEQLEETLRQTQKKQKEIQESVKWSKNRQIKAKRLVKSLGNEKNQWTEKQMKLQFISRYFFGEFIIAAGLIAYLGPFTSKYRNEMIDSWYEIMNNLQAPYIYKDGEFLKALVNSLTIENWIINGLPRDNFSVQNGVIVNYSQRWSLFIDPQKQAIKWIKKTYKDLVRVVKMEDPNFRDVLCKSITNGFIMVAETSTCELDSSLDPVLYKQILLSGDGKMIQIGDLILPYEDRFRFYITTTLPNPSLTPDVFIKLAVINFTISASGLQEQLIGLTVQNEIPGLERYKVRLIESTAKLKEEIRSLQDLILQLITQTKNPIDDKKLKNTLQESKVTTEVAMEKISAANKAKNVLDDVRVKYNIIAMKGQLIYFCVSELSTIDPMYQYSLDWFIDIFNKTLVVKNKPPEDITLELESIKGTSIIQEEESRLSSIQKKHEEEDQFALASKGISFIDYKPTTPELEIISSDDSSPDILSGDKTPIKETKPTLKKMLSQKRKKEKVLRKQLRGKSSTFISSRFRSERLTRSTILLWRIKGKRKSSRFSLNRPSVRSKSSKYGKSINIDKSSTREVVSAKEESIKKERIKVIESTIQLLRNKSNEPRQQRYCFKVYNILKGRRKAMLELQVELKIIKLRRKLLVLRKLKQMKIEERFKRKVKKMHHIKQVASQAQRVEDNIKKRQALLRLLDSPEGRDKLRQHLNSVLKEEVKDITSIKENAYSVRVRCKTVTVDLLNNVYANVCRSLFEKHKVMFAFLLSIRLMRANRRIDSDEWNFFLTGGTPRKFQDVPMPEDAPWMTERIWRDTLALGNIKSFRRFVKSFIKTYGQYQRIVESKNPQIEPLPYPWAEEFTIVQRLLVLKCLRYDRLIDGMYEFVKVSFGYEFIEPKVTDIADMYNDSSPGIPLIFILSPGTDPANDLYKFAQKLSMSRNFYSISLGQGQGVIAEQMFKKAVASGHWVFFQNCHLAPSWMPQLELLVENIDPDFTNKNFRVWLTSLPSPSFPVGILQKSSKITMEPPRGVKANLLRAYTGQVNEFKEIVNNTESIKAELFRCLLFSICLFHGIILERRKYGSLGFNNKYEFTDGDLRICISQLKMFLDEYTDIPFQVLKYTAGQINYGGRITDDWDRRSITHLLEDYYCEAVLKSHHTFDTRSWYEQQPPGTNLEQYVKYIQSIPSTDYPELFGLHENASINYAFKETNLLFDVLFDLHPQVSGGASEKDKEKIIEEKVSVLCTSIPPFYDDLAIMNIKSRFPVMYTESLNTVLVQEVLRYNNLLKVIHRSLIDLTKAIAGTVVMSDALEKMSRSLLSNRVPEMWAAKAYPSLKSLADWIIDLINRLQFIESWQLKGKLEKYWISGLYFPQAFLTACLQNHARRQIIPIDSLSFKFIVMPKKEYDGSTTIHGLFMEGARWDPDSNAIGESLPKILYTAMPDIVLLPEQLHVKPEGTYTCPVYKTLLRAGTLSTTGHSTNFILPIEIPSKHPEGHWVKRSVALFTAVED